MMLSRKFLIYLRVLNMILTNKNYHSPEANREYLSVSQYKDFCGTTGKVPCEAQALAKMRGEWEIKKTIPLMVGSYVDAYFEGTLEQFKYENPGVFTSKGTLRSEYKKADYIIERCERDPLFMKYMSGEKQIIMTAELFGAVWKIKMDSYLTDKAIVDLKVIQSIGKAFWIRDLGYMNFVEYWGYDLQLAIYQEVVYRNTGKRLPTYIAAVSKEEEPDIRLIYIDDKRLQEKMYEVEHNTPKILRIKNGEMEPIRCECCDYCRHTRILTGPIHYTELLGDI